MGLDQLFDALVILGWLWLQRRLATSQTTLTPAKPITTRSKEPKSFPGLIHQPLCGACMHADASRLHASSALPPRLTCTRGRRRTIDAQQQFCPDHACAYYGGMGRGNIRANGHPGGGPWRQLQCLACHTYFQETYGTPLHGKRVPLERFVWAMGALAEELGIRAVARVFEVDPHTALQWLVEAADHTVAFSQYVLHDVHVTQVQLDELFALLSAVKAGEVSEVKALQRLSSSPRWVWGALDPVTKLLLTIDVGDRTLTMAQRMVHQVVRCWRLAVCRCFLRTGSRST